MAAVVALPNGRIAHLATGAAIEALPDGTTINEVASGSGGITLTPGLYTNTSSFYAATVALDGLLSPSLLSNVNVFYGPIVSVAIVLTPGLFSNTNTFYAPTVSSVPGFNTPPLKNNTGTLLSGQTGVIVNVYNPTTGALVLHKTGLTSDGSGVVSVADAALSAATTYAYEVVLTTARRLPTVST